MPEQTFKEKFAQLSEVHVKDRLPGIMQHWVGFQVLHQSDDEKFATGIMAFIINEVWAYIPIIFIKGELKGANILYVYNIDLRVPATDSWVNAINERGSAMLGSIKDEIGVDEYDEGVDDIDIPIDEFVIKTASEIKEADTYIPADGLLKMSKYTKYTNKYSLVEKLNMLGKEAMQTFSNTLVHNPDFANAVLTYHTPEELGTLSSILKEAAATQTKRVRHNNKVKFITKGMHKEAAKLDNAAKKVLMKEGVYIEDNREGHSKVFKKNVPQSGFISPNTAGRYQILLADGTYTDADVFNIDALEQKVIIADNGGFAYTKPIDVMARLIDDKAPELIGNPVSRQRLVSLSERIKKSSDEGETFILFKKDDKLILAQPTLYYGQLVVHLPVAAKEKDQPETISSVVADKFGDNTIRKTMEYAIVSKDGKLSAATDILYIPEDTTMKIITKPSKLDFGNINTALEDAMAYKGFKPMEVIDDSKLGTTVISKEGRFTWNDDVTVLKHMINDLGIYAGQAKQILKEASTKGSVQYLLKDAAEDMSEGVKNNSMNPTYITSSEEIKTNPKMMPNNVIHKLTGIADSGVEEVFDASVLKSLMQSSGVSDLKREFIVDLIKGMDAAGGTLLLVYWNYEMFMERYGSKLSEMESKLLDVFNNLGDLVLFLKEKTEALPDGGESAWGMLTTGII